MPGAAPPVLSSRFWRLLVSLPIEARDVPRLDAVLYTHADDDHFGASTAEALVETKTLFVGPPPVIDTVAGLGISPKRVRVTTWAPQPSTRPRSRARARM